MNFGGKETSIGPKIKDVDGSGFAQVGRDSLEDIGCATSAGQYVHLGHY